MADQNVKINIGSSWNGQGVNKAMGAVNQLSQTAGKAAGAVGSLGNAFGGLDGKIGQSVGAVTRFAGAFASGGAWGLVMVGLTTTLSLFEKLKKDIKESQKELDKVRFDKMADELKNYTSIVNTAITKLNEMTAAQIKFNKAKRGLEAEQEKNAVQGIRRGAEGLSETEQARANLEATRIEEGGKVKDVKTDLNNAIEDWKTASKNFERASAAYDTQFSRIYSNLRNMSLEQRDNMKAELDRLEKEKNDWEQKLKDAATTRETLEEKLKGTWANHDATIEKAEQKLRAALDGSGDYMERLRKMSEQMDSSKDTRNEEQEREFLESNGRQFLKELEEKKKLEEDEKKYREHLKELSEAQESREYLEKVHAEQQKQLEKEVENSKKELMAAQDEYRDALRKSVQLQDSLDRYGYINPNDAQAGQRRKRRGAAANNEDWGNWGQFAQPEGWDQRFWQTHPADAAANGVNPGMNANQQSRYNYLANKMVNGGIGALSDSEREEWEGLKALDPEEQRKKVEEAIENAERNMEQKKKDAMAAATKQALNEAEFTKLKTELDNIIKQYFTAN